jgi:hypothetical protein
MSENATPIETLMHRWERVAGLSPCDAGAGMPERVLRQALNELDDLALMIARTKLQTPRDVAILAPVAWHLHNENGQPGDASRIRPGHLINDHALGIALANLARATAANGGDMSSLHERFCVPPDLDELATRAGACGATIRMRRERQSG